MAISTKFHVVLVLVLLVVDTSTGFSALSPSQSPRSVLRNPARRIASKDKSKDNALHPDEADPSWILLHKGQFAKNMMGFMPDLQTFTICRCDDDQQGGVHEVSNTMTTALQTLLDKYPILRGKVVETKEKGRVEYWVKQGVFSDKAQDYLNVIDLSHDAAARVPSSDDSQMFDYIESSLLPLQSKSRPLKVSQREKEGLPLMEVQLVLLPDAHYAYSVTLSHCIGDATTYYQLVDELCHYMTSNSPLDRPSLDWTHPHIAKKEICEDARDAAVQSGWPNIVGFLKTLLRYGSGRDKRFQQLTVDKDKMAILKQKHLDETQSDYLSTNDVLTSYLARAKKNCDAVVFTRNDRARVADLENHHAGIYLSQICMPRLEDPNQVHQVVQNGHFYAPGKYPKLPYIRGRVICITNWDSARNNLQVTPPPTTTTTTGTTSLVAHLPHPAFVYDLPMDVALVSSFTPDKLIVMHNFAPQTISSGGQALLESLGESTATTREEDPLSVVVDDTVLLASML